jgi:tRNA (guanine37-N1)-methyltransferase
LGKAQSKGLVDIQVHDLRAVTEDNHNTVDDTPYGGGAGMVMLPEVWGKVLDPLMVADTDLIILTPAGKRFNQEMAQSLSSAKHLIFACGRYEGIDDRVRQHYEGAEYAAKNIRVHEVSIGDYVLGGGEVASLVMIEAITRLIPGVLGNPESLSEESHNSEGYLEYPNFTKPQEWRGIPVPEILLSGNHAEIAKWRELQAKERAKKNL